MIKFYLIIFIELIFFPILFIWNEIKKVLSRFIQLEKSKPNLFIPMDSEVIYVVHEWLMFVTT